MASCVKLGDVDAVYEALGPFGLYNLVQYVIPHFAMWAVAVHSYSIVFTGQENPFVCLPCSSNKTRNLTDTPLWQLNSSFDNVYGDSCEAITFNTSWHVTEELTSNSCQKTCSPFDVHYKFPKSFSFISEFDLVCGRDFMVGLTHTLFKIGNVVGIFMFPYFTDRYGRRPVLLVCSLFSFLSCIALACPVNFIMFAAFKALSGVFIQGMDASAIIIIVESLVTRYRSKMFGCLSNFSWTLGLLMLSPISYLLRLHSWRVLQYALLAFFFHIVLIVFFVDESLRWLAINKREAQLKAVLKRASRWNGRKYEDILAAFYNEDPSKTSMMAKGDISQSINVDQREIHGNEIDMTSSFNKDRDVCSNMTETVSDDEHLNFLHLFRSLLLGHTIFVSVSWFFTSLTYDALILMSSSLSGNVYANFTANVLVDIPQAIFCYFLLDKLGRRKCFSIFSSITGLSMISMALVRLFAPGQTSLIVALSISGKLGNSGCYNTLYTLTAELFPTNLRNTGFGVAFMSSGVGAMIAPYSGLLMKKAVYAPGLIFGGGSLLVGVGSLFLPETRRHQLPQTLREMESWGQKSPSRRTKVSESCNGEGA